MSAGGKRIDMKVNLAHLCINDETHEERGQSLRDHNRKVGEYASGALKSVGFSSLGMLAGILHDGKGTQRFQNYLRNAAEGNKVQRGSVNHTFAGCIYILERFHGGVMPESGNAPNETSQRIRSERTAPAHVTFEGRKKAESKLTAEIIAYAVGAHHGLFDCVSFDGKNGFLHRLEADRDQIEYAQAEYSFEHEISDPEEIDSLFCSAVDEFDAYYGKLQRHVKDLTEKTTSTDTRARNNRQEKGYPMAVTAVLVRMVTSAIMYGDRRDTAEFTTGNTYGDIAGLWEEDLRFLEDKIAGFNHESPINRVRELISDQCRAFAEKKPGIYRLNVPTGGGKTLAVLRYAVAHALQYHKKRIVFVAPLLTIIDQNAKVIRDYLPMQETILEHHSDVVMEGKSHDEADLYDVMRNRWSAPVIITTMVQLLEILFSDKTQSVARMRALCDSVIVFDEVQSLPRKTLQIFNVAMNFLAGFCGATIILSSATQPALEGLDFPIDADSDDMVRLTKAELAVFRRCRIENKISKYGSTIEDIAGFCLSRASQDKSILVICNTRREARKLYEKISEDAGNETDVVHLSASMCKAHRKEVLEAVFSRLKDIQRGFSGNGAGRDGRSLILISTQLVEAGVDFSFHTVLRVLAGDDNIVQSAGRCNRSNEYGGGNFFIVRLQGEKLEGLPDIQSAQDAMAETLYLDSDMAVDSPKFVRDFYLNLYAASRSSRTTEYPLVGNLHTYARLLAGDLNPIYISPKSKQYILRQPFGTMGQEFRVFEDDTEDVLVPYGKGEDIISFLRTCKPYEYEKINNSIREASEYSVKIYEWQKKKLEEKGLIEQLMDDHVLAVGKVAYSDLFGLDVEAEYKTEDMML